MMYQNPMVVKDSFRSRTIDIQYWLRGGENSKHRSTENGESDVVVVKCFHLGFAKNACSNIPMHDLSELITESIKAVVESKSSL